MGIETILLAIVIFGTLILVHELGHYTFARIFDVEITEFAIGMGPKLVSKVSKKTGIRYSLRAIPIGGFVSMVGENEECADNPRAFSNKKAWQKLVITAAGAAVNMIIGFILMICYTFTISTFGGTQIAGFHEVIVSDDVVLSARAASGEGKLSYCFENGDRIISVDGAQVSTTQELTQLLEQKSQTGERSILGVQREGKTIEITAVKGSYLVPVTHGEESARIEKSDDGLLTVVSDAKLKKGDTIYSVGGRRVYTSADLNYELMMKGYKPVDIKVIRDGEKLTLKDVTFSTAIEQEVDLGLLEYSIYSVEKNFKNTVVNAFSECRMAVVMVFDSLGGIFSGRFGLRQMSGVVGTTEAIGQAASNGLDTLLYFCALISVNLGIFNLLPVPALDGGHIVFHFLEVLRGKPINQKYEALIHGIGMMLLLLLVAIITISDILKLLGIG